MSSTRPVPIRRVAHTVPQRNSHTNNVHKPTSKKVTTKVAKGKRHLKSKKSTRRKKPRKEYKQYSFMWTMLVLRHYMSFGIFKMPKTKRGDYKSDFLSNNPGLIIPGLYVCGYCFRPIVDWKWVEKKESKMYVDHIRPVNLGGVNDTYNLVPACLRCNLRKSDNGGLWITRGRIGKVIYTTLQITSNLICMPFLLIKTAILSVIHK